MTAVTETTPMDEPAGAPAATAGTAAGMIAGTGAEVRTEGQGRIAVIVIDNPPVNTGSLAVRRGLLAAIEALGNDARYDAGVLIGAGRTFIAGSDITEFAGPIATPEMPDVIAAIERCPKPVVAAIHGVALGGGFEIALACDARIAAADAQVGLPEVTLGMIPGAGGIPRALRLAGPVKTAELAVTAVRLAAADALEWHLIDAVSQGDLREDAGRLAAALSGKRRARDRAVPAWDEEALDRSCSALLSRRRSGRAAREAYDAVRRGLTLPFDEAAARDRAVFHELRQSAEAAALRHLFFAERHSARPAGGGTPATVTRAAVIGMGTMGVGIATAFARAGIPVIAVDVEAAATERAVRQIADALARDRARDRTRDAAARHPAAAPPQADPPIESGTDLAAVASCDLVIEAVFEDLDVKRTLLRALDTILPQTAVIATNTSYLRLADLASALRTPNRLVGMHFFSPATVIPVVEIVCGVETDPHAVATVRRTAHRLGKMPVPVRDTPGFAGNRIFAAYRRECEFLLEEGCYPEEIDAAIEGFGFAMGPFAVADLSGLDVAWRMRQRLAPARDRCLRYVRIADALCEAGRLGRKTGAGWYRYEPGERRGRPDPEVRAIIEAERLRSGCSPRAIEAEEIRGRALAAMVNEAGLVIEEGIVGRPSDLDLILVHGYGFPAAKGGPVHWAATEGRALVQAFLPVVADGTGFGFKKTGINSILGGEAPCAEHFAS